MKVNQIILNYLFKQGITKTFLADMLNESLQNLTKKLNKEALSTDYVERISVALKHNFFHDIAVEFEHELDARILEFELALPVEKPQSLEVIKEDWNKTFLKQIAEVKKALLDNTRDKNALRREIDEVKETQRRVLSIIENEKKKEGNKK